jgi:hypothetical protein
VRSERLGSDLASCLITGAPGTGKTTLGTELSRALQIPFLARDVRRGLFFTNGADGQHAGQGVSSSPPVTGVGDHRQPLQQARALGHGKRARIVGVGDGGGDGG